MSHPTPISTDRLVTHLLSIRHRLPNRAFVACLAIAQLKPTPRRRLHPQVLMDALRIASQPYLSKLIGELVKADLVEYEAGTCGDPGYLFWRVGPR
jgi:DNA-binding IscR family transcriptional regulator